MRHAPSPVSARGYRCAHQFFESYALVIRRFPSLDTRVSRFVLAWICFFRILFGKRLPTDAAKFLPEGSEPKQLPEKIVTTEPVVERVVEKVVEKVIDKPIDKPAPKVSAAQHHKEGALALLALLQREGRFVDFMRDPAMLEAGTTDADIGAAVRAVHRGCLKVLDQYLSLEPVMPQEEEAKVAVPKGFDPSEIRLIGEAKGEAPYKGTLRHKGWRVVEAKLPTLSEGVDRNVIAPAEVELSA